MTKHQERLSRLPLWLSLLFLSLFVLVPLLVLVYETFASPEGFTLDAWRALANDENAKQQLLASLQLGIAATAVSAVLGASHAWLTVARDLPGRSWLGPLGIAPLVIPPIFMAMGLSDLVHDVGGFWPCALLLGVAHAPFVAVLTTRGLRSVDGRSYEAALLLRGQGPADGPLRPV